MKLNKKGDIQSFTYVMLMLFVIAICLIIFSVVVNHLDTGGADGLGIAGDDTRAQAVMDDLTDGLMPKLDFMFLGFVIGSYISLIVLSLFLRTSVLFWVFGFIILIIDTVVSAIQSNIYEIFIADSKISAMASTFPWQNHFMLNLPYYVVIFGFFLMIVLYGFSASYEG